MEFEPITFEQAKALKELGFPQEYDALNLDHYYTNLDGGKYRKEPLELVAKWLREEKRIFINVNAVKRYSDDEISKYEYIVLEKNGHTLYWDFYFSTYEEALSKGIDIAIEELTNGK